MNTKRMIYVGALVLAGIAFLVDRVFLGEPESAYADAAQSSAQKKKVALDTSLDSEQPVTEIDPTLDRLEQLPEAVPGRDVFSLSGAFLARQKKLEDEAAKAAEAEEVPKVDPAEVFAQQHTLQTTMVSQNMSMAVIDGKVVRIGDTVDEFRLVQIDSYQVKFKHVVSGSVVVLSLPSQPQ